MFGTSAFSQRPFSTVGTTFAARLSATSTSLVLFVRKANKIVNSGVDTVIVVLSDIAKHLVSISYLITPSAVISKAITKSVSVASTTAVFVNKAISAVRQAVSSSLVFVAYPVNRLLTLTATGYTSAVSFASKLIVLAKETVFVRASKVLMLVRPSKTVVTTTEQDTLDG